MKKEDKDFPLEEQKEVSFVSKCQKGSLKCSPKIHCLELQPFEVLLKTHAPRRQQVSLSLMPFWALI